MNQCFLAGTFPQENSPSFLRSVSTAMIFPPLFSIPSVTLSILWTTVGQITECQSEFDSSGVQ